MCQISTNGGNSYKSYTNTMRIQYRRKVSLESYVAGPSQNEAEFEVAFVPAAAVTTGTHSDGKI